ncbi:MAG: UbiA family prenyltransferase [Methanosarcinaceae archaeon]|nr:UbiA family prenyltransferase [Methanosarcinaceae archaeon]
MNISFQAYTDLTRAHFFPAWPLLFCSGLMLAFENYGAFSLTLTIKAAFIGLFGFEAGLVLNDYVDRDTDTKDVEFDRLTGYWRPFKKRPIPPGQIAASRAFAFFLLLFALTMALILTLPFPNSLYLLILMSYSYCAEYFYQVMKRDQRFPIAQILGRTDIALFPVAGYLCYGSPDMTALLYFLLLYPWAQAHLGVNDLADFRNDVARDMKTITTLYGTGGTAFWIHGFTLLHIVVAIVFMERIGTTASYGFILSFLLLGAANYIVLKRKEPHAGLKALPLFHASLLIYSASIILDYFF